MLGRLRRTIKPLLYVAARPLARARVAPHVVTFAAIPCALGAALALDAGAFSVALALTLAAALADLLDGTVAELQHRVTPDGNYVETMVDKIVEVTLFAGAARAHPLLATLACGTSLLVSFAKARVGLVVITDNRDWPAIGDRADRLLAFMLGLAFVHWHAGAMAAALIGIVLLNVVGVLQRVAYARRLIAQARVGGTLLPYLRP